VCLAIPGKIISTIEENCARMGRVQFGDISRLVSLELVPEAQPGDFVLVHVGYAISRMDTEEAERTFCLLEEMGLLEAEGLGAAKTSSVE
jgi:hydrogenase expression/formation protein HypC